jgi:hypothetical protein
MIKIIFSLVILPMMAWAAPDQALQLKQIAQQYKINCPNDVCQAPLSTQTLYSRVARIRSPLYTSQFQEQARVASTSQAQIWGDTILEGDYYAAGHTRVDAVVSIYQGQDLVAYKLLYSEKSWDTSTCAYNGRRDSLADCRNGRIAESSFALPDFKTLLTAEGDFADFEPDATNRM